MLGFDVNGKPIHRGDYCLFLGDAPEFGVPYGIEVIAVGHPAPATRCWSVDDNTMSHPGGGSIEVRLVNGHYLLGGVPRNTIYTAPKRLMKLGDDDAYVVTRETEVETQES